MYPSANPVDLEFSTEKVLKLAFETAGGVTSLYRRTTGELLNAWHSDLFTHAFTSILSSQRLRALSTLADPLRIIKRAKLQPDLFLW